MTVINYSSAPLCFLPFYVHCTNQSETVTKQSTEAFLSWLFLTKAHAARMPLKSDMKTEKSASKLCFFLQGKDMIIIYVYWWQFGVPIRKWKIWKFEIECETTYVLLDLGE